MSIAMNKAGVSAPGTSDALLVVGRIMGRHRAAV